MQKWNPNKIKYKTNSDSTSSIVDDDTFVGYYVIDISRYPQRNSDESQPEFRIIGKVDRSFIMKDAHGSLVVFMCNNAPIVWDPYFCEVSEKKGVVIIYSSIARVGMVLTKSLDFIAGLTPSSIGM